MSYSNAFHNSWILRPRSVLAFREACNRGQSEKQRRDIAARIAAILRTEERVLVATGCNPGEGLDDSRLDTFLAVPIAWKGTLAQYAGRLPRLNEANMRVPVLTRMAAKRRIGY